MQMTNRGRKRNPRPPVPLGMDEVLDRKIISIKLEKILHARNIPSVAMLAKIMRVHTRQIEPIVSGKRWPTKEMLARICVALDCDPCDILEIT
jgi:DNA-binding Xre family transcriptional regulator